MRLGFIVHNEATNGRRIQIRTKLLAAYWKNVNANLFSGADYGWITNNKKIVGVQSKTATDFFQSWVSGLLQRELEELLNSVDIPVLLLEGWPYIDRSVSGIKSSYGHITQGNRPVSYQSFSHAFGDCLSGLPNGAHLYPIISADMKFTIDWLTVIGPKKFDDPENETSGWNRIERPTQNKDKALQAVMALDGISEKRGRQLLEEYGSYFGVIDALRAGYWDTLDGIGQGIVDKVIRQGITQYKGNK